MPRAIKQIVFGAGFLVIIGFISFGIYQLWKVEPTCSDQIQNQGEEGVDCGFVCTNTCLDTMSPIDIQSGYLFKMVENDLEKDYDVLFKIRNPNSGFGASEIEYEVNLFDAKNSLFLRKRGFSYILPGQTKYIYEPMIRTEVPARRVELKIISVSWQRLRGLGEEVQFAVRSKDYAANGKPGVFSHASGTIYNNSNLDFDRVDLVVVLFKEDIPVRANKTDLRTFLAGTDRYFEVDWTQSFEAIPDRVDVEANTNVFESFNFINRYGTEEKFQRRY
ncbi:MAG: hypothetical protein Q7S32_04820 [bacterium]|nr:hypothetical protein [bacterium]